MVDLSGQFAASLKRASRWVKLVDGRVPALVIRPIEAGDQAVPFLLWFHGRTVTKELDSGRYLRLMRAGVGCVAIDLPGHGERLDPALQDGARTLEMVLAAASEIDAILGEVGALGGFDTARVVIGGMSAGGMVAMVRGCRAHSFSGMLLEATTGDWRGQRARPMYREEFVAAHNPIDHLDHWREIPVLALHAAEDEWVALDGQRRFIDALKARADHPERIALHAYDHTGAPHEHMGFGKMAADAKERGTAFVCGCLGVRAPPPAQA